MKKTLHSDINKLLNDNLIPTDILNIDTDKEWLKFKQKNAIPHTRNKSSVLYYSVAIAASIILLLGLWLNFFAYTTYKANTIKNITLADNSKVTLAANSTLKVSKLYGKTNRKLKLQGTAFFEVTHNPQKPFTVETNNFKVQVKGTKFLVSTIVNKVAVTQGIVQVNTKKQTALLTKGQQAQIKRQSLKISHKLDDNLLAWKTKQLDFNSQTLEQIATTLSLAYSTKIKVSPNIKNLELTAKFENQDLQTILDIISKALDIKVDKNNGVYYLHK